MHVVSVSGVKVAGWLKGNFLITLSTISTIIGIICTSAATSETKGLYLLGGNCSLAGNLEIFEIFFVIIFSQELRLVQWSLECSFNSMAFLEMTSQRDSKK